MGFKTHPPTMNRAKRQCEEYLKKLGLMTPSQIQHNATDIVSESKIRIEQILMAIEESEKPKTKKQRLPKIPKDPKNG